MLDDTTGIFGEVQELIHSEEGAEPRAASPDWECSEREVCHFLHFEPPFFTLYAWFIKMNPPYFFTVSLSKRSLYNSI